MKYIYILVITSFLFHLQCISQSSSSVKYLDFYGTEISSPGKATYYIISVKTDSFYEKKTYFAHSDKIKLIEHFVNSKKTGNDTAFYEEGTIRYIVSYKNNKIDGELYAYYENKNIKRKEVYSNDSLISRLAFSTDGDILKTKSDFIILPEYPGGINELIKYLAYNIKYPAKGRREGKEGKVYVMFTVNKKGAICNSYIDVSLSPEFDNEALRVVNNLPNWKPGLIDNSIEAFSFRLPVSFKLQ